LAHEKLIVAEDFIVRLASSVVVTSWKRSGFIDAANAPESLKQRILNGVE
jgi:hypothetical protein